MHMGILVTGYEFLRVPGVFIGIEARIRSKSGQSKRLSESLKALLKVPPTIKEPCVSKAKWLRGRDLNPRPPGYEPDELPTALPRVIVLSIMEGGTGDRTRTGTRITSHRILSPRCLPIPPLRHIWVKNGSEGGARTHNLPVNSRLLCH